MAREQLVHALKCWSPFFEAILIGAKRFELRKNDRDFHCGDLLLLRETRAAGLGEGESVLGGELTGRECYVVVNYLLDGHAGLAPGYVVMGISRL